MPATELLSSSRPSRTNVHFTGFFLAVALLALASPASAQQIFLNAPPSSVFVGQAVNPSQNPPVSFNLTTTFVTIGGSGSGSYNTTLVSGSLPSGLTIGPQPASNDTGIAGIFTAAGTFTFTLQVTDALNSSNTATITATTVVTVNPLTIVPATLPGGLLGTAYGSNTSLSTFLPAALGGIAPYHWTLLSGSLPPGMTALNATTSYPTDSSLPSGALTGTPTAAGTFSFTLRVTDSSPTPQIATQSFSLSVTATQTSTPPTGSNGNLPDPFGIVTGPDGALWFTEQGPTGPPDANGSPTYGIGSVTTGGSFQSSYYLPDVTIQGLPTPPSPLLIATGTDQNLWFTTGTETSPGNLSGQPYIGQMSTSGSVNMFALTPPGVNLASITPYASGIASDPSGAIWFTIAVPSFSTPNYGGIGKVSTANGSSHAISYFTITSNTVSQPQSIIMGPDGALWFADQVLDSNGNTIGAIGRMTTAGVLAPPPGCSDPSLECPITGTVPYSGENVAAGSDGAIWFSNGGTNQIGRITTDGKTISLYQVPTSGATPGQIVLGSDGALWFTETSLAQVGRITTAGVVTEYPIAAQPIGITSGPDGALWITDNTGNIERIVPSMGISCNLSSSLQVGAVLGSGTGCSAFGGTQPYTYSVTSGSLPPGLTIASSSGVVSGVPSTSGTYAFTVTATDTNGQVANQVFNVAVAPRAPLVFTCTFPGGAQATVPYTASCTTSGGIAPYTYSISTGSLPGGLSLTPTANGVTISGTPSAYGAFSFTVQAADSGTPQFTASQSATAFTVLPPPLVAACNFSAKAEVNVPYASKCTATGGIPPYTFTPSASAPSGLSIDATGLVTLTPTTAGTTSFSVQVHDNGPPVQTVNVAAALTVIPPKLALMCDFSKLGKAGTAYTSACTVINGVSPYQFKISSGALPPGMTLTSTSSSGTIGGTPTNSGLYTFTIQLKDSDSPAQTAIQNVSLSVLPVTLKITSTSLADGAAGLPYSANPIAAGGTTPYSWSITAGSLPAGLTLNTATGAIDGTPEASGAYSFTLQAVDSSTPKQSTSQAFSGTISTPVAPDFAEYPLPVASGAAGITSGPDGALWFTTLDQTAGNLIGRATTAGAITTFPSPNPLGAAGAPGGIVTGPDGTLWFSEESASRIGQISTPGTFSIDYPTTTADSNPLQITAGPDGALWFSESATGNIGQMSPAGVMLNEFATPTSASGPAGTVVGPDNAIWFTEGLANNIGRITTDGVARNEYPIPTGASNPTSIAVGPDGALWFTEHASSKIGRITPAGVITEFTTPTPASGPQGITAGPDGALYFTELSANQIGRITTNGTITEYAVPTAASGVQGITLGSDGALWFTEGAGNKVGRFAFVTQLALTCTFPPSVPAVALGSSYNATCTASKGQAPYTYSVSKGSLPAGVSLNAQTGAISGVVATPGTYTFTIQAGDSSDPQQTASQTAPAFTVLPGALTLNCAFPSGQTGTAYTGSCTPSGGTPPYSYSISAGALPNGLTLSPTSGAVSGTPTAPGTFTFTVLVADSSSPQETAAQNETVTLELGSGAGGTIFSFAGLPQTTAAASNLSNVQLQLAQAYPVPLQGTIALSFNALANDGEGQLPTGYTDPAFQFVDSNGNGLGLTYNFTIPAGATSITLPAIYPGTVAGTITLTATSGATSSQQQTLIPGAAPVIEPGSVHFTNQTATSFDVVFTVTDVLLNGQTADFAFTAASGDVLQGLSSFPVDVSAATYNWFSSPAGQSAGGVYSITVSFPFTGSMSAIGSVSVTLRNSFATSQPVSGNP